MESTDVPTKKPQNLRKLAATAAVLVGAAGLLTAGGVWANFTDTQNAGPAPITTGIVHIALSAPSGDNGSLTTGPIHNMAEGDTVSRVVQLTNDTNIGAVGTTGLAATNGLTLQTSVAGTNALSDIVTDGVNGLHVTVQACSTAPTETGGTTGPWTYTCTGGFTTPVTSTALHTLNTSAVDITSSAPVQGSSVYYVITATVPTTYADAWSYNSGACSTAGTPGSTEQLQGCSLSINYDFTATQRAGAAQ